MEQKVHPRPSVEALTKHICAGLTKLIKIAAIARARASFQGPGHIGQTAIVLDGDLGASDLGASLLTSLHLANSGRSPLPSWIMNLSGMSGRRYRRLVNNLVRLVPDPVYLEVGSWKGSTACAAVWSNHCEIICIDNWSEFGGPRDEFLENIERASASNSLQVIEDDFRAVNFGKLQPKANIYLFDGPHGERDQFEGIAMALPGLRQEFVLIVDDFNWAQVREGTFRALLEKDLTVLCSVTIRTNAAGLDPKILFEKSDWHNGYFLAVVTKPLPPGRKKAVSCTQSSIRYL